MESSPFNVDWFLVFLNFYIRKYFYNQLKVEKDGSILKVSKAKKLENLRLRRGHCWNYYMFGLRDLMKD